MNPTMTPQQALQLLSDALEPKNIGTISRQGFVTIQVALETLAAAITTNPETDATHD